MVVVGSKIASKVCMDILLVFFSVGWQNNKGALPQFCRESFGAFNIEDFIAPKNKRRPYFPESSFLPVSEATGSYFILNAQLQLQSILKPYSLHI